MRQQTLDQAYRETPWRSQMQIIGMFLLLLVMTALIAGIYLNVTARAATIGRQIQGLHSEIQINERVNADLETQLAVLTSASNVEARARDLGYRPASADEYTYIYVDGYAGRKPVVLAPPHGPEDTSTETLPPEFTQSLIEWLRELTLKPSPILRRISP